MGRKKIVGAKMFLGGGRKSYFSRRGPKKNCGGQNVFGGGSKELF